MNKISKSLKIEHWVLISALLAIYDAVTLNIAYFAALFLRFDASFDRIPDMYMNSFLRFAIINTIITLVVYYCFRLYNSIWRFASYMELIRTMMAVAVSWALHIVLINTTIHRMPISYAIFGVVLQFCAAIFVRFAYRFILLLRNKNKAEHAQERAMIIGAGAAGNAIMRDLQKMEVKTCCFIDDNPNKQGRFINGVEVAGGRDDILSCAEKYKIDCIYIAIPSANDLDKREIINIAKEANCDMKVLPGLYQFATGDVTVRDMHDVDVQDLLGRDVIKVNNAEILEQIANKIVLVTGGGGSIGSEICRQIAANSPKQLIIFDIYENNAYDIQQELLAKYKDLNLKVLIGSVRDIDKVNDLFKTYKPEIVFHAAAHKHVPLMEDSPCEAIKNNVLGTYNVANAALKHEAKKFVLISTDKAVNPTNVMGASKRICEMMVQGANSYTDKTTFVAVRFGNVLGSNGSVIPLFKKQIEHGGPVTVTHPDIIRYFMTIPEAVSLVLQASYYAKGGEIYVLDMGEPMKIDTLARNLIKLSGLKPDVDIPIVYSGLRPGEKLYEEKLMDEEGLQKTPNDLIHIAKPIPMDKDELTFKIQSLVIAARTNDDPKTLDHIRMVVPTYQPAEDKNTLLAHHLT